MGNIFNWHTTCSNDVSEKIKPEGKNIYIYIYDFIKYVFMVKMPNKQFINDRLVEFTDNKEITFRQCVKVVDDKNGKIETSSKDNKKQYAVNERGRRIRILPNQEQINSNPEQKVVESYKKDWKRFLKKYHHMRIII